MSADVITGLNSLEKILILLDPSAHASCKSLVTTTTTASSYRRVYQCVALHDSQSFDPHGNVGSYLGT